jgi:serine/threonine protein kinase
VKVVANPEPMQEQGQIEAVMLARLSVVDVNICPFELSQANEFRPFPILLVRLCSVQLLSALDHCHLSVPGSNIIIKLIDSGSSCFDGQQRYEHIKSRFFRAPDVILGVPSKYADGRLERGP